MIINWPLLWIGTIVLAVAYIRMRDRILIKNRSKIEITILSLVVVFLLIDIYLQILERKDMTENVNDCIRYYRYYDDANATDFYFIQNCYDYLTSLRLLQIKESGIKWKQQQVEAGFTFYQNKSWEVNQNE